jgi:hypothetical protein
MCDILCWKGWRRAGGEKSAKERGKECADEILIEMEKLVEE